VLTPPEERLNSFYGGAIARWVYNIYTRISKESGQYLICGRISGDGDDYKIVALKSKLNACMSLLMKIPFVRRLSYLITVIIYSSEVRIADVVEVHNSYQMIKWLRLMGFKKRLILHMHNDYLLNVSDKTILTLESHVDDVIVCSKALQNSLKIRSNKLASSSIVVYNGVDTNLFFPKISNDINLDPVIRLLYVGRIVPAKGVDLLIGVYQKLLKLKPDSELKIVGSSLFGGGESRYGKECQQQIDSLKAAGAKAEILGYVHNAKLPDLYNWASLFCSFSRDEAFGMTYIEALACKTLVLANRVGGVSEAVGFEEMLITDNLSASEIVNRILDLSNHYMGSYLTAESYSRTIQLFSWWVIARQHSEVLSVSVNI